MARQTRAEQIGGMSASDRIREARVKAEKLDNLCLEIEAIHANNRYLIYDDG